MHQRLLTLVAAFLFGLFVGGLAFGDRGETGSPESPPQPPLPVDTAPTAAAATTAEGTVLGPLAAPPSAGTEATEAAREKDSVDVAIDPMGADERNEVMLARWANLEERLFQLAARVESLERRTVQRERDRTAAQETQAEGAAALSNDTPEDREFALVAAGVPAQQAEDIIWRQSQLDMARLELQDRAMREGWFQTERYFEELRGLNQEDLDLRAEIGESSYDRYLYQTGERNRVRVASVMQGSQAELSGLLPGDVIESYAGERIFSFGDLRDATTRGVRDEPVPVVIRRDDVILETWIARGPIGVRLEAASAAPDT